MNETLRAYLDRIGIYSGDNSSFIVEIMFKGIRMEVSRRYLECEPWEHLLDYEIVDYEFTYTIYGQQTVCFFIQEPNND